VSPELLPGIKPRCKQLPVEGLEAQQRKSLIINARLGASARFPHLF
jgi:hypothetical protein